MGNDIFMSGKLVSSIKRFLKHPLFLSFYLPSFLVALAWGVRTPVLPLYAHNLTARYSLVGIVVAGASLGTLITDLPAANYIGRMDRRLAMALGIGLDAAGTLALFWVDSVWLAILLRFLGGVGHAVFSIARHAYITDAVRVEMRGRALSLMGGTLRAGLFIGPAIGGIIADRFNLRLPFVGFAVISLVAIVVIGLSKDQHETQSYQLRNGDADDVSLRHALKGRLGLFTIASLGNVLVMVAAAGESLILPLWGADQLMLSAEQIGWAVSLSSAFSLLLFYPVGLMMDRVGRKAVIVPSAIVLGVGLGLLPLTNGFAGFLLAGSLIGLGYGLGSGAILVLGSDLSPKAGRSAYLGAWRWVTDVGSSGGPVIVGWVAEVLALPFAALIIAGAGVLAGVVFGLFVPETLKKPGGESEQEVN